MSALQIVGVALFALPMLALLGWVIRLDGWSEAMLILAVSLVGTGLIALGAYLMTGELH